jgi:hypothetical protein
MNFSNGVTQVLLFFIFILVLLFINKYFFNIVPVKTEAVIKNIDTNDHINDVYEEEDPLTSNNKNDLKIVNNKIKVFNEVTNTNDELINELLPKYSEFKKPTDELDKHFMNNNIVYKPDINVCNIKEEKTDLPIVNIKICNISNGTKLSELS